MRTEIWTTYIPPVEAWLVPSASPYPDHKGLLYCFLIQLFMSSTNAFLLLCNDLSTAIYKWVPYPNLFINTCDPSKGHFQYCPFLLRALKLFHLPAILSCPYVRLFTCHSHLKSLLFRLLLFPKPQTPKTESDISGRCSQSTLMLPLQQWLHCSIKLLSSTLWFLKMGVPMTSEFPVPGTAPTI